MRRSAAIALLLLAAAFVLRVAAIDRARGFTGDEALHVPNAFAYAEHGHLGPDNWHHPPLKHLLTYASIRLFGDGPYGWRLRNVVLGAGSVALLFLLGEALLGAGAAAIAAVLLALDPLHVTLSRSTFEDVPAVFFLLAGLLLALRHVRTRSPVALLGAGVALGLSVALRTYVAVALLAVAGGLAAIEVRRGRAVRLLGIAACLFVVPAIVYVAAYAPWFRRGHGLGEWLVLQRWSFVEATTAVFGDQALLKLDRPWRWFLAPAGIATPLPGSGPERSVFVMMNDLPVWILVLPAMTFVAVRAVRERRWDLAAVPAAFALLYAPFLAVGRSIFLYSSIAVLPFGFLAVGFAAKRALGRWAPAFAVAVALWCLYLYPVATAAPISPARYEFVLRWLDRPERT